MRHHLAAGALALALLPAVQMPAGAADLRAVVAAAALRHAVPVRLACTWRASTGSRQALKRRSSSTTLR